MTVTIIISNNYERVKKNKKKQEQQDERRRSLQKQSFVLPPPHLQRDELFHRIIKTNIDRNSSLNKSCKEWRNISSYRLIDPIFTARTDGRLQAKRFL